MLASPPGTWAHCIYCTSLPPSDLLWPVKWEQKWYVLPPEKGFQHQCSICPILVSCLRDYVDNMSIASARVPEWLWETELPLTQISGLISWLRNKILLCRSTETSRLFVTVAQPNRSWLIHPVKSRFGCTKLFIPDGFSASWVSQSIKVPILLLSPLRLEDDQIISYTLW